MGFDPITIGLVYGLGSAVAGPAAGLVAAGGAAVAGTLSGQGEGSSKTYNAPPLAGQGQQKGESLGPKKRRYRPAAQVVRDEDLRLGASGKLGL